ncbi:MAG: enoyl-CoA hydratase, partial [Gammaproteobacteria bacterium]
MKTQIQTAAAEGELLSARDNGIARLTLNRPAQYNALSEALLDQLARELESISLDASVRVVVLGAAGKAFCAGHDLKEMRAHDAHAYQQALFAKCSGVMSKLTHMPQPVIARVQGMATAAGCQLVASCDLAVASVEARFAVSGVRVGLFCSTPAVALSRNISRKRAMEMLLTGDFIDADAALRYGLINRAVAAGELDAAVDELAEQIACKPPRVIQLGKRRFYQQLEQGLGAAY